MKKRKGRVTAKLIIAPNPILTQVCEPVADGEDVSGIIRDMMHILVNSKTGVGLAAPQAGYLKRIIIISPNGFPEVMINPNIDVLPDAGQSKELEGCLSYPDKGQVEIERYNQLFLSYWYEGLAAEHIGRYDDYVARIIQHEIDHLNGKCKVGE